MKKYLEILRKCSLFDDISNKNLIPMLGCLNAEVITFKKGETVFHEGEPAKNVGIVLAGALQIIKNDFYGNRNIITNIEPSRLFGEAFACADVKELPVTVVASENSEIMMIDCRRITSTCCNSCEFHNQIIFNLLKILAVKNIQFNMKAEVTSMRTTREKLLAYLMQRAKICNSNTFTIPFNRQELADYLQVDRSGLSVEISKLKKECIIESNKNKFRLL